MGTEGASEPSWRENWWESGEALGISENGVAPLVRILADLEASLSDHPGSWLNTQVSQRHGSWPGLAFLGWNGLLIHLGQLSPAVLVLPPVLLPTKMLGTLGQAEVLHSPPGSPSQECSPGCPRC